MKALVFALVLLVSAPAMVVLASTPASASGYLASGH